ncbi:MAG: hypothetical protein ACTHKS_10045 [Gaiellaceae bacterium]
MTSVTCQHCGRFPARAFTVRRHVGLIFLMRNVRIAQTLCRECARRELARYTGRTLVEGWWGILSLLVVNPVTIALNVWNLARSLFMKSPQLPNTLFDDEQPTTDHMTMLIPIAIGLLCLIGITGVVWQR